MISIDPVCGMEVDTALAAATSIYQGETIYFCALGCKQAFDLDPHRYMAANSDTLGAARRRPAALETMRLGTYLRTGGLIHYPPLRTLLGVPEDRRIAGIVYVGYPAHVPERRRTSAAHKTHWLE